MKHSLIPASLALLVSGCGEEDSRGQSETSAVTIPDVLSAAAPSPGGLTAVVGGPTDVSVPDSLMKASTGTSGGTLSAKAPNPFQDFDFKGGTAYPAKAQVRIGDADVAVGAAEAHVPITLDRPTPNTIIARVMTRNGSGGSYGVTGQHFSAVDTHVIFRPGDPLTKTVRIALTNMTAGRHFDLFFPEGVLGGVNADGSGKITAVVGAAATVAQTSGFRAARPFTKSGTLAYQLDPANVTWSDAGGSDSWTTKLPHGRTQPGNAETGLYLDAALHQSPLPPFAVENGILVVRSQQVISPIMHGGTYWYHGAAILTGQKMPATQLRFGQYQWEAQMPNRRGGWPALWLLPTTGWPPEIDVYEGFGYSSGWNFSRNYAANIHGGAKNNRTFTAMMQINAERVYGIKGFDSSYHGFGVDIAPDFITWFIDGREVYQAVNPFAGTTWFPLMNVAVKHQSDYVGGTSEMRVRSFKVWKVQV